LLYPKPACINSIDIFASGLQRVYTLPRSPCLGPFSEIDSIIGPNRDNFVEPETLLFALFRQKVALFVGFNGLFAFVWGKERKTQLEALFQVGFR
jgi:hypothetical protein